MAHDRDRIDETAVPDLIVLLAVLEEKLPPLLRTDVNERTLHVWRRYWIDRHTVGDIALELGWCVAAVEFHLRRAAQIPASS